MSRTLIKNLITHFHYCHTYCEVMIMNSGKKGQSVDSVDALDSAVNKN